MIGKTLYKAKVKDGKVITEERAIVEVGRKYYHFNKRRTAGVRKDDVGVVVFLTKEEAVNYLIKQLKRSIKLGEQYLLKTKDQLNDAQELL